MTRPIVLSLDGSTNACTVALLAPGAGTSKRPSWEIVARGDEGDGRGQARVLLQLIDELLCDIGEGPDGVSAIVVGTGPGTFTGVRVTVATARALGLALDVPVVGCSTLAALAAAALAGGPASGVVQPDVVVPVVDARRGQVFYGIYERRDMASVEPVYRRQEPFAVCDRDDLAERVAHAAAGEPGVGPGRAIVIGETPDLLPHPPGDALFLAREVTAGHLVIGQDLLIEPGRNPEGDRLDSWLMEEIGKARGARSHWADRPPGAPGTPESVNPIYVRAPDADIHITKMRDPWATPKRSRPERASG